MPDQIPANRRRTALLVLAFVALLGAVGAAADALLGTDGVLLAVALLVAVAVVVVAFTLSERVALRVSHARPAVPDEHVRYHNLVEGLCVTAGLPMPRLYVVDDPAPNAFAVGRHPRRAALVATTGLLDQLSRVQLEGVLAHELAHVRSRDTLPATVAVTLLGLPALAVDLGARLLAWGGVSHESETRGRRSPLAWTGVLALPLLALVPVAAQGVRLLVAGRREPLADFGAVRLTRYPPGLVSALERLRDDGTVVHSSSRATAHLWIGLPLERAGRGAWLNRLFDTHPPLELRIEALEEL